MWLAAAQAPENEYLEISQERCGNGSSPTTQLSCRRGGVCWGRASPDLRTMLPYLWLPINQGLFSRRTSMEKAGHFWKLSRGARVR